MGNAGAAHTSIQEHWWMNLMPIPYILSMGSSQIPWYVNELFNGLKLTQWQAFTSDFPHANIELISPDLLHQIIKGLFKDHLVTWVEQYIRSEYSEHAAKKILADIDCRYVIYIFSGYITDDQAKNWRLSTLFWPLSLPWWSWLQTMDRQWLKGTYESTTFK